MIKKNQIGDKIRALRFLQILKTMLGNHLDTDNPEFTGQLILGISPRYCLCCAWTCKLIASTFKVSYKLTYKPDIQDLRKLKLCQDFPAWNSNHHKLFVTKKI